MEAECKPRGGIPDAGDTTYSYLLCFQPILATNHDRKNLQFAKCLNECCPLMSNKKITNKLENFHRGNYWCRVEHESKDPNMARNSTVQQIDVECTSCNVFENCILYTLQDIVSCQTNLNILNNTF